MFYKMDSPVSESTAHQNSVRAELSQMFIETVERIVNRKVRAFNSSIDTHTDVSVEVFHLEPVRTGAPVRTSSA